MKRKKGLGLRMLRITMMCLFFPFISYSYSAPIDREFCLSLCSKKLNNCIFYEKASPAAPVVKDKCNSGNITKDQKCLVMHKQEQMNNPLIAKKCSTDYGNCSSDCNKFQPQKRKTNSSKELKDRKS